MIKYAQAFLRAHSWFVAVFQALLVLISLSLAWYLRFDYRLPDAHLLFLAAPVLVFVRLLAISYFGLLHGWWKYTGASDVLDVLKAIVTGSVAFVLIIHFLMKMSAFPRSVYLLEPIFTAGLLIGIRIFSRLYAESVRQDVVSAKQVILIGAGVAAQTVVQELKGQDSGYVVLGCLDDDVSKAGIRVGGVPVLGKIDDLPIVVERYSPDEVLIAVPSASGKQMQRFVEVCERARVQFRTVPNLRDIMRGDISVGDIRKVRVEDLLGREPIQIEMEEVKRELCDRVVIVTGAAGSIGSELCRQIMDYSPRQLLCIDQNETGMFYLHRELSVRENAEILNCCVADIGDSERMRSVFAKYKPQVIFHAAAYKHVPVMESNVQAAVMNNVFGLVKLLEIAKEVSCDAFVLISSDKAVNPTSIMGATKRIGELVVASQRDTSMRCASVRFGNVLFSNGSVVPIFEEQIRNRRPLTITHPDITRFFMTTYEAVALVLQALVVGEHGDTLVLDMGSPVRIVDLAQTLIRLQGKDPAQVPIAFTGLREGEKLHEELFYSSENVTATAFPKIKRVNSGVGVSGNIDDLLTELQDVLFMDGASPIRAKIKEIVPEYMYQGDALEQIVSKCATSAGD